MAIHTLDHLSLTDLVDVQTLQRIQDAFAKATGMAALTVDLNGPITQLSNGTDFCMKYTRASQVGAERCNQCDLMGGEQALKTHRPSVYYCHGGLMDFAAPILLGNRQIGSLIGGQVLPVPADENKIRAIARDIGVNEDEYIAALRKIKVVPKESIENAAELLYIIGNTLSEIGAKKLGSQQMAIDISLLSTQVRQEITIAHDSVEEALENNKKITETFLNLESLTQEAGRAMGETGKIIQFIGDISMQSRLLGMNASIEAAHAGALGAGFSVIAQEVRSLADKSAEQTKRIEAMLTSTTASIQNIVTHMGLAYQVVEENSNSITRLDEIISRMGDLAERLKTFD